jgi:hypothetical protein
VHFVTSLDVDSWVGGTGGRLWTGCIAVRGIFVSRDVLNKTITVTGGSAFPSPPKWAKVNTGGSAYPSPPKSRKGTYEWERRQGFVGA